MKAFPILKILASVLALLTTTIVYAQQTGTQEPMQHAGTSATPLAGLIEEATANNPRILASVHAYKASTHKPKQEGALPDTQLMVQHLSVGSPRPFAGYTNSDFAYIGLGASQEFPYPGKRKLRAEVAAREADSLKEQSESAGREVIGRLKAAYFQLAFVQQAISLLQHHDGVLANMEQIVESQYRVGKGDQQEVLRAQLQHTRILQEIAMNKREEGRLEAQLKQLLGRSQDSPDIVAEPLRERPLPYTSSQLLQMVKEQNPAIRSQQAMLRQAQSQVALTHKEFRPDFNLQYMYQNTDRKFRDYYMLTFGMNLPNRGRRRAELAESLEKQERAAREVDAEIQGRSAELQEQLSVAQTSSEQLKIYNEGLIPQAAATFRSALAAYQANRQGFQTLLSSFLDVLDLDLQYQRNLADHESALAQIEALTGVTLP